jgi:hypothetical protein
MSAEALIARLEKARRIGAGRWSACCPAHPDRTPSLRIRELDDGRVLVKCFGQDCSFQDIVSAAGIDIEEMFPPEPAPMEGRNSERRPFLPLDVIDIILLEVTITALIACDMHKAKAVSDGDYDRLLVASGRLNHIAEVAYGPR